MWIYGNGGHARVIRGMLPQGGAGVDVVNPPEAPWIDAYAAASGVIAVGNNQDRKRISLELKDKVRKFAVIFDPASTVRAQGVGEGTVVMAGAVAQPGAVLGRHVIVNTGATVDHDCNIGDFAHIAPGVHLCGGVTVGEGTLVGAGSVITPGVKVGPWLLIRAGSVVTKDVATREEARALGAARGNAGKEA